jgi:hypothetical protein
MTTNDEPLPHSISASFKRLSASAAQLNEASDELGQSVEALDASLKPLGIGVPAWVPVVEGGDPHGSGYFWRHELGYAKVGSKWGIAVRSLEGNVNDDEHDIEEWLFADAPRALRIQAVDHLPRLLDKLCEAADKATEKIKSKIGRVQTVVAAVEAAAPERPAVSKAKPPVRPVTGSPHIPTERRK